MEYKFNEKEEENGLTVWQSPKYRESKIKAIEMIDSKKYGLTEGDFWILMNKTKNGAKMAYTGLIISHNGCLKINEALENKVNPKCFAIDKDGYNNSLVYTYIDDDVYEVGEYSNKNSYNDYPYAMAFKRCFDRVVLKKSKLAFSGIYSEVEAEEFRQQIEEETANREKVTKPKEHQELEEELDKLISKNKINYDKLCEMYKLAEHDIHHLSTKQLENAIANIDKFEKIGE